MEKKAIYAIVAVIVIVAAGAGVYWFATKDSEDPVDPNAVTFLIEDDKGVYFWMAGSGDTTMDAFKDAADKCGVKLGISVTSWGESVDSIAGLAVESDFSKYWSTYIYDDGKWKYSENSLSNMKSSDHDYIAMFYVVNSYPADPALPSVIPDVKDAFCWDESTKGVLFCIESSSGMYYYMNSSGETVFDALSAFVGKYNIQFTPSESSYGKGIQSLYGWEMEEVGGDWKYWSQSYVSGGEWMPADKVIGNMNSSDYPMILINYGGTPLPPVYS